MLVRDPIHDHCSHRSGFLCQWNDTSIGNTGTGFAAGWTWHRTLAGAQKSRTKHGGKIFKILGDDHTEEVRC